MQIKPINKSALAFLFFSIFFLSPTQTQWANIPLLFILIIWLGLLFNSEVRQALIHEPIVWVVFSLYGLVLIGTLYTPSTDEWVLIHLRKYARFLYVAIIFSILVNQVQLQKAALIGFIGAMLFTVASTWLNVWFILPWSASQKLGFGESHHVFGDYITQNVMVSFFAVFCLNKALTIKDKYKYFWAGVAIFSLISITHLSQGRTGFLLVFTGLAALLLIITKGKFLAICVSGLIATIALSYFSSDIIQQRFEEAAYEAKMSSQDNRSSIGHRLFNYRTTLELIKEKPIFGHGTGAYHTEICNHMSEGDKCRNFNWHPHNQFLFIAAEHGILGLALYFALIILMYISAFQSKSIEAKVMMASLASIMTINSLINSPWWSSIESQFFAFTLALWLAKCKSKTN